MPPAPSPELLLADAAWLRALARRLTGNADAADDLQQEVTIAALAAPKGIGRPWLVAVARKLAALAHRRSAREARHLRLLATPDAAPSTADLVATAELQQRAVAAVLALPPACRDTVLLRFLRGLSLEQTASHLGLPLETVRTRQKRALARLRAQLLPADEHRRSLILTMFLSFGVAMKKPIAAASVVLLLTAGSSPWLLDLAAPRLAPAPAGTPPPLSVATTVTSDASLSAPTASRTALGADQAAPPPAPPPAPAGTAILVRAVWDDDASPAAAMKVLCRELEGPAQVALTDASGSVRFAGLEPGRHEVCAANMYGVNVEAVADTTTEATLRVPRGFTIRGRVVDATGAPVPQAEVLVRQQARSPSWSFTVGNADAQGRFAVEGLMPNMAVAARDPRRGASDGMVVSTKPFTGEWPHEVVLHLRDEAFATLRGRVVAADGRPVANAWVQVGRRSKLRVDADGTIHVPKSFEQCRTGADGKFEARWLLPGPNTLHAYRRGLASHTRELQLTAHESADVLVELRPGGTITGTVRLAGGKPAIGATVYVPSQQLPPATAKFIGANATFQFEDLPPGEVEIAVFEVNHSRVTRRFTIRGTETHDWDCVLGSERSIHGRLLDHDRKPLAGWFVQRPDNERHAMVDAEGRFVCTECNAEANTLLVRPGLDRQPVRVRFDNVVAKEAEQTFVVPADRAPTARVRGRCLGPDGSPLAGAAVSLHQEWLHVWPETRTQPDGSFELGPLPPGRYRVSFRHASGQFAPMDVDLDPQEVAELPAARAGR